MQFKIHVDGAEHEVEAGADGRLVLDGQTFQAKVGRPSDDRRMVQLGDKTYEVRVVEDCVDTGIVVLELAGERVPMTVTEVVKVDLTAAVAAVPAAAGGASAAAPQGEAMPAPGGADSGAPKLPEEVKDGIWAPVPGKIVDVFVQAGDVVEEGAAVLVLEAMKMENELHAPHKGTVAAVLVKKGDQAEKGQLLVAFK
jgi:biotin carboxyl carrier protein